MFTFLSESFFSFSSVFFFFTAGSYKYFNHIRYIIQWQILWWWGWVGGGGGGGGGLRGLARTPSLPLLL